MAIDREQLEKHRMQTKLDVIEMLKIHQRVCVVRPCSYGKTHLIAELCTELSGKKLVVEPANVLEDYITRFDGVLGENITIITYQSLLHKTKTELKEKFEDIQYIFLDEVHRVGAEKWGEAIRLLTDTFFNAKVIGMSATPVRSDGNDIIDTIFNGIQVEPLHLGEAIMKGLLPNVCYVSALYTITEEYRKTLEKIENYKFVGIEKKSLLTAELKDALLNYEQLNNIPNILQKYLFQKSFYLHHMKFIVFCSKVSEIDEAKTLTKEWFEKCYENTGIKKKINLYDVHCHKDKKENIKEMRNFEKKKNDNEIDIIVSVNMFNEGLHLNGVTGVILLRKTTSNIVYFQQIGRAISQSNEIPIIFDFVNNHLSVSSGYIKLFQDYIFECKKDGRYKKHNYYNNNGQIIDYNGNLVVTKNGEIINIHDETKDVVNIIDAILKKTKSSYEYLEILDNNLEWLKQNSKNLTPPEISQILRVPKLYIPDYLRKHKLTWIKSDKIPSKLSKLIRLLKSEEFKGKNIREMRDLANKQSSIVWSYSIQRFKQLLDDNDIPYIDLPNELTKDEKKEIRKLMLEYTQTASIAKILFRDKSLVKEYIVCARMDILNRYKNESLKKLSTRTGMTIPTIKSFCYFNNIKLKNL